MAFKGFARRPRGPMTMRYFVRLACCLAIVGCDPGAMAAIQVAPQPAASPDSGVERAFAIVERVAERQGLAPASPGKANDQGWAGCFARSTLFVCAKRRAGEAQFQMRQTPRFSDSALQLKNDLLDALRLEF